jgi:hypothetical protein
MAIHVSPGSAAGRDRSCRQENAMKPKASLSRLLQRVHADERGAVSIETILIIGAIAIPILIFLLRYGWPRIKNYFNDGMTDLEAERGGVMGNN